MLRAVVTAVFFTLASSSAFAQSDQSAAVTKAVSYCVKVVHRTKLTIGEAYMAPSYRNFDAFYDSKSGQVENSARIQGDEKPLFVFQNCMSDRGAPLASGSKQADTPAAAICTDQELGERNGDCWVKLSPDEKKIVGIAFINGHVALANEVDRQLYAREAMNPTTPILPDDLIPGFDALYATPEYRTISFADASDLLVREGESATNSDLGYLREMYRDHQGPMLSGYIQKFVPPNKLVIAQWDDSTRGRVLSQQYGNQTETITMLGLSSTPPSPTLNEFMNALLNVKSCHTLMTEADALSQGRHPLPESLQKGVRDGYSTELDVVVSYPNETDTDTGPQFFNAKGELSADILIDTTHGVCDRPDASIGAAVVTIGDLLFGIGDKSDFEPLLGAPVNKFISLNAYLLANELQPGDDMHGDPRPAAQFYYRARPKPLPDAVAEVLKVGAPN